MEAIYLLTSLSLNLSVLKLPLHVKSMVVKLPISFILNTLK